MTSRDLDMELRALKAAYRRTTDELVNTQLKLHRAERVIDALLSARDVRAGDVLRRAGEASA